MSFVLIGFLTECVLQVVMARRTKLQLSDDIDALTLLASLQVCSVTYHGHKLLRTGVFCACGFSMNFLLSQIVGRSSEN